MAGPVLYSTNPRFTEFVCDQYRGGRYGILWCSEFFDPASHGVHSSGALIPPSSSPKALYYDVLNAVRTSDHGNQKLKDYRNTFTRLARDWESKREITRFECEDIDSRSGSLDCLFWRGSRLRTVGGSIQFRRTSAPG